MNETVAAREDLELDLRRERAELPGKIASASRRVQVLRAEGHKAGSAELEAALEVVAELVNREAQLPSLILEAAGERVGAEAAALREEGRVLAERSSPLHDAQAEALRDLRQAEKSLEQAQTALQANMLQREMLATEARLLEGFVSRARQASESGDPKLVAHVLEDGKVDGMLLPWSERRE